MPGVHLICMSPLLEEQARHLLGQAKVVQPGPELRITMVSPGTPTDRIEPAFAEADVVLGDYTLKSPITAKMIQASTRLRLIQQPGSACDHIDVASAKSKGVPVANCATADTASVAEHTLACALALLKRIPWVTQETRAGRWTQVECGGRDLFGKTWGILGLGRVGREVARRVRAFDAKAIYFDVQRLPIEISNTLGAEYRELKQLLMESDVLSIHAPLTDRTRGMIGKDELALLKSTTIVVNVARGEILDERALGDALRQGKIAGAAVDVLVQEPVTTDCPLQGLENCLITPHIAGVTIESQQRILAAAMANLGRALRGEPIADRVV